LIRRDGSIAIEERTTIAARWLGDCKVYMSPGDVLRGDQKIDFQRPPELAKPNGR
jgi:hypothetical protein